MRAAVVMLASLGVALCLPALPAGAETVKSNIASIRPDQVNEAAIRKLYADFTAAWNRHDVAAMASMWTIDGDHLEPDGHMAKGREAIQALLDHQHKTVFKDTTLDLDIDAVWFVTGDVALVDGSYALIGARDPKGNELPVRKGHLTSILLKEHGRWNIAASRLMIPTSLPWRENE